MKALELAKANGVSPGARCFSRLIDAHGVVGDLPGAAAVLDEALASLSSPPAARKRPPPDAQLFASLMKWVAVAGDSERAEQTMELARRSLAGSSSSSSVEEDDDGDGTEEEGQQGGDLKKRAADGRRARGRGRGLSSEAAAVGDETADIVLSKLFAETLFQSWWQHDQSMKRKRKTTSSSSSSSEKLAAALEAWRELLLSSPLPSPLPSSSSLSSSSSFNNNGDNETSSSSSPLPASFSLDLHSFNHWSAQLALLDALKKLLDSLPAVAVAAAGKKETEGQNSSNFFPDLLVITGRGNRSKDRGAPPVRRAALSLLHSLGCPAALVKGNDGCVVVKGSALAELFTRERASGRSFGVEEHSRDLVGLDFHREVSLANRL